MDLRQVYTTCPQNNDCAYCSPRMFCLYMHYGHDFIVFLQGSKHVLSLRFLKKSKVSPKLILFFVIFPKRGHLWIKCNVDFKFWGSKFIENLIHDSVVFQRMLILKAQALECCFDSQDAAINWNGSEIAVCSSWGTGKNFWNLLRVKKYV